MGKECMNSILQTISSLEKAIRDEATLWENICVRRDLKCMPIHIQHYKDRNKTILLLKLFNFFIPIYFISYNILPINSCIINDGLLSFVRLNSISVCIYATCLFPTYQIKNMQNTYQLLIWLLVFLWLNCFEFFMYFG